jgi:hypothetical protein
MFEQTQALQKGRFFWYFSLKKSTEYHLSKTQNDYRIINDGMILTGHS